MSAPILTFFSNNSGVGKTSLVYHLAWLLADEDITVLVADLDPQANLTAAFLDEDTIEPLWDTASVGTTIYNCIKPLTGVGDIVAPKLQRISSSLHLIPGDIALSGFEETLSREWPTSMGDTNLYRPMRIESAFWQVLKMGAEAVDAEIVLVDIGPSLGAINRSALIATDDVVIPLGADLFSLQGLKNLGPTLREWKSLWQKRIDNWNSSKDAGEFPEFEIPGVGMRPIGYLCQQAGVRLTKPVKAYDKWVNRIPAVFREYVIEESIRDRTMKPQDDPYCLATIRHYRSLVPMAQEHRKPIFHLTSADGAIGSHANAVQDARRDFKTLAKKILDKMDVDFTF